MSGECTHIATCELFPLLSRGGFLKVWQQNYCSAGYTRCARYRLATKGEPVPLTLLPSGDELELGK